MLDLPAAEALLAILKETRSNAKLRVAIEIDPDEMLDFRKLLFDKGYSFVYKQSLWSDSEFEIADCFNQKG